MIFSKNIFLFICCSFIGVQAMRNIGRQAKIDFDAYIEEHKENTYMLEKMLIKMGRYKPPNLEAAKKIIALGVSANATDPGKWGATALTDAVRWDNIEYAKFLLEHGAKVDLKDPQDGFTGLLRGSADGHEEIVALFLQYEADPNASDSLKETPLIKASKWGHVGIVKLLLNAKEIDVNHKSTYNPKTALASARKAKHNEIIKLLIEAGATE
jgi:ankyrin repeat protein